MKKNNAIGFTLIALILVGFFLYNSKIVNEQQKEQQRLDSLKRVEQIKFDAELELLRQQNPEATQSSVAHEPVATSAPSTAPNIQIYGNTHLDEASNQKEQFFTLENDLLRIQFTNHGAKPYSVEIKNYETFDGKPIILFEGAKNDFSLQFYTQQQLNTAHFFFTPVLPQTGQNLQMRLYLDTLAYIEYSYSLSEGSYKVDFDVRFVGMQPLFSRNTNQLDLHWCIQIPRSEKGYDNEKNYSTIAYKYPGNPKVENLGIRKSEGKELLKTKVEWIAFQQQFFSAILMAPRNFTSGDLAFHFFPPEDPESLLMYCNADLQIGFDSTSEDPIPFEFYFGPNHYNTLKSYGNEFQGIVPMGGWLIGWINKWFIIPIFDFLSRYIRNYGIIILILTIIIKIVLYYPNHKSYLSTAKMRVLKPEVEKINAKYPKKEDAIKKQQETMALYKKTGVNMFGGCLPMLFQIPILFAMFRFFPTSFELRQQGFLWATDLSSYDSIWNMPFSIPMYGDHVSLFALLMGISMYFYAKINQGQMDTGSQQMPGMNGMMLYFMPIFMVVICNNFSSGLSYYYMLSNVITMLQTWVIRKYFVDDKKILAQLHAKANAPQAAKPKSKFQQRLDEAYKLQQQRAQQQRKK
ncbi:MAG: membrane protein insertase YidC [Prevotellaceae bacterium]|jgi:YidC/Oxa1 family membrane protein insertase|nr:membrane protein insertase YidC [Prevotellaceae bacterium]